MTVLGIIVKVNEKGWMNEKLMAEWADKIWLRRKNPASTEESLLIIDSARCHLTEDAKKAVQATAKMAVIPGGLTKKLQPLDISVNKSFKSNLRKNWEQWMLDKNKHTYTKAGRMRHATYLDVCEWVLDSWESVTPACIQNGFRRALDDDAEEDSSEEENEFGDLDDNMDDLESLPDALHDALDQFHIISDDDFDGFDEL